MPRGRITIEDKLQGDEDRTSGDIKGIRQRVVETLGFEPVHPGNVPTLTASFWWRTWLITKSSSSIYRTQA